MNIEQEREDFAQAWRELTGSFPNRSFYPGKAFKGKDAEMAWMLWQARAALQEQPAMPADPIEALKTPLTPYGLLVRALRIVAGTTLMEMSRHCGVSPAFLSGVETNRKPLTANLIASAHDFFAAKGVPVTLDLLQAAASVEGFFGRRIEGEAK